MANYLEDVDLGEGPDWSETNYTDADVPDDLPNWDALPVEVVSPALMSIDEPPGVYVPILHVGVPEAALAVGFEDAAPTVQAADPRVALETELNQIALRLERSAENENPVERFFEQDVLLEEQAALAEELEALAQDAIEPEAAPDLGQVEAADAALSTADAPDVARDVPENPLTPFTIEDVAAAAAEREAGIAVEPGTAGIDAAVERLTEAERAEWDARDAEDQERLESTVHQAEQAAE